MSTAPGCAPLGVTQIPPPPPTEPVSTLVSAAGKTLSMRESNCERVWGPDGIPLIGADATRMYALFATTPDRALDWQEEGVAGIVRFLTRVHRLVTKYASAS